jgi:site-specific recombinase XerD
MELFLDTGLRLNEVCALDLKDVHVQGAWCRVYGKGRKEAIVPLGRKLCRDLSIYIHAHRKPTYQDEPALFINRFGHRLEREGLAILVRRALANIGIEGKHGAHTLRHTFATNFLRNGGSLEALRRILRHNDIKVTQRYIHLVMDDVIGQHHQASPLDHMRK